MLDNKMPVEHYEDVRDNYAEDISKNLEAEKFYLPKIEEKLKKHRIICLDRRELLRIAFYIEDMTKNKEFSENLDIGLWIINNIERNPGFYRKYFRVNKALSLPSDKKEETKVESKKEVLPDLSNISSLEEKAEATKLVEKIWIAPEEMYQTINKSEEEFSSVEVEEQKEDEQDDEFLINSNLTLMVLEAQEIRKKEITTEIQKIINNLLGINLYDKTSLVTQLAEIPIYKQLIVKIFEKLGVESLSTNFDDNNVQTRKLIFNSQHNYTLEELKRGTMQALVKVNEFEQILKDNFSLKTSINAMEIANKHLQKRNAELLSKIRELETNLAVQISKLKVEDSKLLYLYIGWEEQKEDKTVEIWYLATKLNELNDAGYYLINKLYKTKERAKAIRFKSREFATKQLLRIDKNYKNIDKSAKISLKGHIHNAKFFELVESERPNVFTKIRVIEAES